MMGMTLFEAAVEGIYLGLVMSCLFQIIRIRKSVEDLVSSVTLIAYGVQGSNVEKLKITWCNISSHWLLKLVGKSVIRSVTDCP